MRTNMRTVTAVLITALAFAWSAFTPAVRAAGSPRSYVAGNFSLSLDGTLMGALKSASGGEPVGTVVQPTPNRGAFAAKNIGAVHYEDIALELGFGMAGPVYDWIAASWKLQAQRKNGAIILSNANLEAVSQREFTGALITETTVPTLDASSKSPGYLGLKLNVERTVEKEASGKVAAKLATKEKQWLPSNFRLDIDGLDCTKVSKIDSFTVKQVVSMQSVSKARDLETSAGRVEFPNLKITISAASIESWQTWFESFVVQGQNDASKEKAGTLTLLAPNRSDTVAQIKLYNLGIFALRRPAPQNGEAVADFEAELYCERMELIVPAAK